MSMSLLRRGWAGVKRPDRCSRHQAQRDRSDPRHQRPPEDRAAPSSQTVELTRGLGDKPETDNRPLRGDALLSARRQLGFDCVEQVRANLGQDSPPRLSSSVTP